MYILSDDNNAIKYRRTSASCRRGSTQMWSFWAKKVYVEKVCKKANV